MSRFKVIETPIGELKVIERQKLGDFRGFISRLFCAEELAAVGWQVPVVQINQTVTQKQGTVRGMHYQIPPHNEAKFISCLHGAIWDVAIDLRVGSPTFLQMYSEILSESNQRSILIPNGFAHGFQTLSNDCELIYLHSCAYSADFERGLNPLDPMLSIKWPIPISELSNRDRNHSFLDNQFKGVTL